MSFVLQPLQDPRLHEADGSLRTTVVLSVVLFVPLATFVSDDEMLHWVLRYAALGVDVEATHGPGHHEASVGVVGFGVGLGLESLALSNLTDDLVEQLRRQDFETEVFGVPHGTALRSGANVV